MASSVPPPDVRLADVVAAVSLATDLACGSPLEEGLRRTLLVVWLGEELGLDTATLRDAYYVAHLGALGCTIEVALFERPVKHQVADGGAMALADPAGPIETAGYLLGKAAPPPLAGEVPPAVGILSESQIMCRDVSQQLGEMLDIGPNGPRGPRPGARAVGRRWRAARAQGRGDQPGGKALQRGALGRESRPRRRR
jgi:hypothetical protein